MNASPVGRLTRTPKDRIEVRTVEWHLLLRLGEIGAALVEAQRDSRGRADHLRVAKAALDETERARRFVAAPIWGRRAKLHELYRTISSEGPTVIDLEEGLI
jgi:hypothetical protein